MKANWQTRLIAGLGGMLIFAAGAQADLTVFQGGDVMTAGNWSEGLPGDGTDGLMEVDGTFSDPGNSITWFGDATITIDGANLLREDGNVQISMAANSYLVMNSGSFTSEGGLGLNRAGFDMNGGSMDFNFINLFGSGEGEDFRANMHGGTVTVNEYRLYTSQTAQKDLYITGGSTIINDQLRLGGGTGPDGFVTFAEGGSMTINAATDPVDWGDGYINFLEDSINQATLSINGFASSDFETLYSENRIRFDNSNEADFSQNFSVTDDTLSVIPEPSVSMLFILGGVFFGWLRRMRFS